MKWIKFLWLLAATIPLCAISATAQSPSRTDILELVQRGWIYEIRTTMRRPGSADLLPDINPRTLMPSVICIVGEEPNGQSLETLQAVRSLLRLSFSTAPDLIVKPNTQGCPDETTFVLRLYSGGNPQAGLAADLHELNARFDLRLGRSAQNIASPAQAQTFFGRNGTATHLIVAQAGPWPTPDHHHDYYRSILIEELFQALTFGADILYLSTTVKPFSKLHEQPVYVHHLPWRSDAFISGMLDAGPIGLCGSDLVVLAALGQTNLAATSTPDFLGEVRSNLDGLLADARGWQGNSDVTAILDPDCQHLPD